MDTLDWITDCRGRVQSAVGRCGSADDAVGMRRRYLADFCGEGKCVGTDLDDCVQYSVWNYFVEIPLLG